MTVVPQLGGVYRVQAGSRDFVRVLRLERHSFKMEEYYVKYLLLLGCSLVFAAPAWAQTNELHPVGGDEYCDKSQETCMILGVTRTLPDDEITVTATGTWTKLADAGQSISVNTAADLATIQGPDLTRVFERLPGVSLARSGGLGSQIGRAHV